MFKFNNVQIKHIRCEHNAKADMLSRLATTKKKGLHRSVIYVILKNPIVNMDECMTIVEKETWMKPMKCFLENGECGAQEDETMGAIDSSVCPCWL